MGNRLYVGNLSYGTTEDDLAQAFGEAGTVAEVAIIMDRETGRSKGFGFVTYETDEGAAAGIQAWNGRELGGRTLKVDEARPRRSRFDGPSW